MINFSDLSFDLPAKNCRSEPAGLCSKRGMYTVQCTPFKLQLKVKDLFLATRPSTNGSLHATVIGKEEMMPPK